MPDGGQAASPRPGAGNGRALPALLGLILMAGCATAPSGRPKHPSAPLPPILAPTRVVPPVEADWRDLPLTPGAWRYAPGVANTSASYGPEDAAVLVVRCDKAARQVTLTVPGAAGPLTVRTSSSTRTLPADGALPARDPFLDEIAFSRGRFSVSQPGGPTLYLPAWAEPSRVIEDCRG